MLLLTMTPTIVAALKYHEQICDTNRQPLPATPMSEADLPDAQEGKPISHEQIIYISREIRQHVQSHTEDTKVPPYHLSDLLRGSRIYVEPPKPKPETTQEYKALMARLRHEEEARAYDRMVNPIPIANSTTSPAAPALAPTALSSEEDDEMTYADVHRQMMLILNVLISIIACGIAIWLIARSWAAPARLALSMSGSGVVGVAEVVVYAGYIRRLKNARDKERKKVETKVVEETWVIEARGDATETKGETLLTSEGKPATGLDDEASSVNLRRRRKE